MIPRRTLWLKWAVLLSSAVFVPGLSCVTRAADVVGDGLTTVGAAGVRGTATVIRSGIDLFGTIVKAAF